MVRINNSFDFEVYSWDTLQSFAERLSANDNMNTIPKYLYLPDIEKPMTIAELKNIDVLQVNDFLKDFRTQKRVAELKQIVTNLDIVNFLVDDHIDVMEDIIAPFIALNNTIRESTPEVRNALFLALKNIMPDTPVYVLWRSREDTIRRINSLIQANKNKVKDANILLSVKGLEHTDFIRQEVALRLGFDLHGFTLLEVFDLIKLDPRVPFASANNIYKILRDFTPDPNWGSLDDNIYLQFRSTPSSEQAEFIDAVMIVDGELGQERGIIETGSIKYKYGMTADVLLSNLRGIFHPRLPLRNIVSETIREKGRFYYNLGEEPLDSYVFGDLALNDPVFSQYIAIDEHEAATKGKRSSIYIHFFGSGDNVQTVRANITVYQVRSKDIVHRSYGYKVGTYYLNVLISNVQNKSDLDKFILIFGKLLALYYKKAPGVIRYYQSLLPPGTFPPKYQSRKAAAKGKKTKKTLKEQAPEVFVSGYPTKCGNQPRIISAEEAAETKNVVMQYPKTATEGFPQRWYVCDEDSSHPYPGLRDNDLSNNNIVPYLPCCFKTPQDIRGGQDGKQTKPYAHYFYDIPMVSGVTTQQNILTRDAFTDPPKVAVLPNQLEEMLNLITYKENWRFVRQGVFDSKASFLECVLEGLQSIKPEIAESLVYSSDKTIAAYEELNKARDKKAKRDVFIRAEAKLWEAKKEERLAFINKLRVKLATIENASACRQEMYDYTNDEILETIRDPDIYFDPHFLTNLVERYFGCNIILFSRVSPGAEERTYESRAATVLTLPRHIQAYYKTKTDNPTILIYERLGRGSEQTEYPRCELITYWDGADIVEAIHTKKSKVANEMDTLYERVRESYNLNCLIPQTIIPLPIGVTFTHQRIDSYGKCRAIIFQYQKEIGTLLTTPMQPFRLPVYDDDENPRLSYESASKLLKDSNLVPVRKTITGGQVSGYSVMLGNTRVSLIFTPTNENNGKLALEADLVSNDQTVSKLSLYTKNKRIARYMVEYTRWLYSKFLEDQKMEESTESLQRFMRDFIRVNPSFKYGPVSKTFSMNSGITTDGVLYVHSIETKKRLIYTLQLFALQNPNELTAYRHRTTISNYYMNIGDFTRYRSQVILQGDNAVEKWINERERDYHLYDGAVISPKIESLDNEMSKLSKQIQQIQLTGGREALLERLTEKLEELVADYEHLYQLSLNTPHFFKNSLVGGDQMYLYQQASDLSTALSICNKWNTDVINDGKEINNDEEQKIPEEDFTIYSYRNPSHITPYVCEEGCVKGKSEGATLLGYKSASLDPTFISLLPLGHCEL